MLRRLVDWAREPVRAATIAAVAAGVLVGGLVGGVGGIVAAVVVGGLAGLGAWALARELPPPPLPEGWNRHDTLKPPPAGGHRHGPGSHRHGVEGSDHTHPPPGDDGNA